MTKKNIMPVVVLSVICLAVAALLAGVNHLTKDKIAENNRLKEQASLIEVLPTELGFNTVYMKEGELPDGKYELPEAIKKSLPETVTSVYQEIGGKGFVFVLGDNRNDSKDSRHPDIGLVDRREILGKAVLLVCPGTDDGMVPRDFGRIGAIK